MTSKSELKRLITLNPLGMVARIQELEAKIEQLEHQHKNDEAANRMLAEALNERQENIPASA